MQHLFAIVEFLIAVLCITQHYSLIKYYKAGARLRVSYPGMLPHALPGGYAMQHFLWGSLLLSLVLSLTTYLGGFAHLLG